MRTEKQLANLIPYKPGQTGNPKGRPKDIPNAKKRITNELRKSLDEIHEVVDEKTGEVKLVSEFSLLIKKIKLMAINQGNEQMIKLIWNYFDGMPQEFLDVTSGGETLPKNIEDIIDKVYGRKHREDSGGSKE